MLAHAWFARCCRAAEPRAPGAFREAQAAKRDVTAWQQGNTPELMYQSADTCVSPSGIG